MTTATYSPDDNKLRIYPMHRLDQSACAPPCAPAAASWLSS